MRIRSASYLLSYSLPLTTQRLSPPGPRSAPAGGGGADPPPVRTPAPAPPAPSGLFDRRTRTRGCSSSPPCRRSLLVAHSAHSAALRAGPEPERNREVRACTLGVRSRVRAAVWAAPGPPQPPQPPHSPDRAEARPPGRRAGGGIRGGGEAPSAGETSAVPGQVAVSPHPRPLAGRRKGNPSGRRAVRPEPGGAAGRRPGGAGRAARAAGRASRRGARPSGLGVGRRLPSRRRGKPLAHGRAPRRATTRGRPSSAAVTLGVLARAGPEDLITLSLFIRVDKPS
ncbi:uncharacterized protein [Vicugna pacos]|uniref:Translation initiation factor IF-2-like n=1 Tax=Vicugna pacos TaxID=30538 RepID=A0ABM5EFS8_VICPA